MINNIRQGSIIKSFNWPEPVEIKFIEETGEYVHIVGATTLSREHIDQIIPIEEFSKILIESMDWGYTTNTIHGGMKLEDRIRAEGIFKERQDGFLSIESIPYEIRRITEQDNFRKNFGGLLRKYPKVTFDKEIAFKNQDAEFFSFGHPLFEAMMIWIENNFSDVLLNGATFSDPDGKMNGYILFYGGEIKDGKGEVAGKRLFGFYTDGKEIRTSA